MENNELLIGISPLVYVLVDQAKVLIPMQHHRYLPLVAGLLGLLLTLAALYFTGPYGDTEWFWTCLEGTLLGFAATGLFEAHRQQKTK